MLPLQSRSQDNYNTRRMNLWRLNAHLLATPKVTSGALTERTTYFKSNDCSEMNRLTLWNAHKAYMWEIFIKLGAIAKTKLTTESYFPYKNSRNRVKHSHLK